MAVPDSGNALSLAGIKAEIDNNSYSASATSLTSLQTIAEETTFNSNSGSVPNATAPHAMSEWYSYDHDAAASFANAKAVSRASHLRKFKLVSNDFSISGGELTPTMKLKRKVTEKKY